LHVQPPEPGATAGWACDYEVSDEPFPLVYPVSIAATAHSFSPNIRGKGNNDERLHYAHYPGVVALLRLAPAAHLCGRACAKCPTAKGKLLHVNPSCRLVASIVRTVHSMHNCYYYTTLPRLIRVCQLYSLGVLPRSFS
jgi:hypothetical protein